MEAALLRHARVHQQRHLQAVFALELELEAEELLEPAALALIQALRPARVDDQRRLQYPPSSSTTVSRTHFAGARGEQQPALRAALEAVDHALGEALRAHGGVAA